MDLQAPPAFSAKIRLSLLVAGQAVPLSQVAPTFCIAREPIDLSPQAAEIFVDIDDVRHTHRVFLTEGMSAISPKTMIQRLVD